MESWRKIHPDTDTITPLFSFLCNTSDHLSLIAVCILKESVVKEELATRSHFQPPIRLPDNLSRGLVSHPLVSVSKVTHLLSMNLLE